MRVLTGRRTSGPATRSQACLQPEAPGGVGHPPQAAIRPPATQALAQALDLGFGLRLVHVPQPVGRPSDRPRIDRGARPGVQQRRGTRSGPALGRFDQAGTDGIAFDVAQHRQQVIVFLDGKGAKTALPDMAAGVVMLVVAAHFLGQ